MMRLFLILFLFSQLHALQAQQATSYFPETPGAGWVYNLTISPNDTISQTVPRVDVLTSVTDADDGIRRLSITSSLAGVQNINLQADTVRASFDVVLAAGVILQADSLLTSFLDLQLPQSTLFVTSASVNSRSSINSFRQRIATPEILKDAIESEAGLFSVTLDDSLDVVLTQSFKRLPNAAIQLPAGEFNETFVFETILDIEIEIGARTPITGRITLTIPFLDDYSVTSWYAPTVGLIKQSAPSRTLSIDDRLLPVDVNLDTIQIPAFELILESFTPSPVTSLDSNKNIPHGITLYPNYPNPFNPSTVIPFELQENAYVNLRIYDSTGRTIATLTDGTLAAGKHQVTFNAGDSIASGAYFIVLLTQTSDGSITRLQHSMLLLK
ncbi:MAG: T9SS type A sorting domain-containing protein [Bacteroidetes bacterium]|nr:T9SS type A sorting domain-containing protein [Bacteroidota bacterium]